MTIDLEKMWALDIQDEDAFLCFVLEQAPDNSYWIIELHCLQPEDKAFLAQLGESNKINNASKLLIPLTDIIRPQLISKVPDIGGIIHHRVDGNGEPFMISYDSFSSCWLSKTISSSLIDEMSRKGVFFISGNQ